MVTTAEDEWVVMMHRSDGRKQLVQGLTVPRITCDFPLIPLDAAEKDLKMADPSNDTLQRCTVPPLAGGVIDVLLGIKYNTIFPEPVHTLPNGLTIYKSKLASYQGRYDSCIGGPHSSFEILADAAGGTAQLLAHFVSGLQVFRQWGAQKITSIDMTEEEITRACEWNGVESEIKRVKGV